MRARPVPCRKSVQKQESRRFSISGKGRKMGKSAGMAGKNTVGSIRKMWKISDENRDDGEKTRLEPAQDRQKKDTPEAPKYRNCWRIPLQRKQPEGKSIPENVNFPSGKSWEKWKNYGYGEKNFPHGTGKNLKMIRKVREKCPRTGSGSRKKQAFPSKKFRKSTENTGMGWKNFSALGKKNIPMKRKNLENGWSGWKNNRAFFTGRRQKNAGKEAGKNPKIYQAYPKKAWKTYGW